jgi:hypothetical protein
MPHDTRADGDSKEQKRIKKIIADFLKEGANRECSECQTKRPSWYIITHMYIIIRLIIWHYRQVSVISQID